MSSIIRRTRLPRALQALLLVVPLAAAGAAAGCASGTTEPGSRRLGIFTEQSLRAQLARARDLWAETAPARYAIVVQRGCFCPPEPRRPVRVVVRREPGAPLGVVESATYADDGTPVAVEPNRPGPATVEVLFSIIESAIEQNAASVRVEYDPEFGYPRSIFIDYDERMADEELGYTATGLAAAP